MSNKKKNILFTYSEYTVNSTVSLMKRLLAMFPEEQFTTHLLKLTGKRPNHLLLNYIKEIGNVYLYFSFDCLGFEFSMYDDSPYFNTTWMPCVTCLTVPASRLDKLLRREMNLNITILCLTKSEETYICKHYPQYEDVRTVINPLQSLQPLYSILLTISNRYPLI